jgi:hypothetical protein
LKQVCKVLYQGTSLLVPKENCRSELALELAEMPRKKLCNKGTALAGPQKPPIGTRALTPEELDEHKGKTQGRGEN